MRFFLTLAFVLTYSTGIHALTINLSNGQSQTTVPNLFGATELVFNVPAAATAYLSVSFDCKGTTGITSSSIPFRKIGPGKLIVISTVKSASNVFVEGGTLQIGNGTVNGDISVTSTGAYTVSSSATLRFEPSSTTPTFGYNVSGAGTVAFAGNIHITGVISTTGKTVESGITHIGNNGTTGSITGNITVNNWATLRFYHTDTYTYAGVISGAGHVSNFGSGKTILTGANTYTGITYVDNGTLQIGNGSTGSISANTTSSIWISSNGVLHFEPGAAMTVAKTITGAGGKVQVKGTSTKTVTFTGDNTYSGGTTIHSGSYLYIGAGGTTGAIAGNVLNSGVLIFNRSNEYKYAGIISGQGQVTKQGTGKTVLLGQNTYTGSTTVSAGTLQIGDGQTNGIIGYYATKIDIGSGANLRIEPYASFIGTFWPNITGAGNVQVKGGLRLGGTGNTYSGTTTIEANSSLYIGSAETGTVTDGSLASSRIVNNGKLIFCRSNAFTYGGVISGTGEVIKRNTGTLTLTGANTYEGLTDIYDGTLLLGSGGTIASSAAVYLMSNTAKFSITGAGGNKTVKGLHTNGVSLTGAECILGANTLQIGTSATVNEGNCTFAGIFSGTGGVTKTGLGAFEMMGANTATGTFTHNTGTVVFYNRWRGNYILNGGTLDVRGSVSIGNAGVGTFSMVSGKIVMNLLSSASPAKSYITIAGNAGATNVTLAISASVGNNQVLMTAAGGFTSTTPYTLDMPGFAASLNAGGTSLSLNVSTIDNTPPIVGGSGIINGTVVSDTEVELSWTAANDGTGGTPQANLRYYVYRSTSNNISTVANCTSNGTLLNPGGTLNLTSCGVMGLTPGASYYFNVVVADLADNRAAYTAKSLTTTSVGNEQTGQNATLRAYPNPTTGKLRIMNYELREGSMVEIYDAYGKKQAQIKNPRAEIDISHLPTGIYFLNVDGKTVKVVKQ